MSVAFSTIIIPALTGITSDKNPNEIIHFSPSQASWFGKLKFNEFWHEANRLQTIISPTGSFAFICQPLGSLVSGWICEPYGRKWAMFVVNVPHCVAYMIMYNATEVWHVFLANVLIGIGIGLVEAPTITYVGEIAYVTFSF